MSATLQLDVGPRQYHVVVDDAQLFKQVEVAFSDAIASSPDPAASQIRLTVESPDYVLRMDGMSRRFRTSDGVLAGLCSALTRAVLDVEPSSIHLHCGAVARSDKAILLVGASGAGKTTLVAELICHGWTYLSDEMVTLSSHAAGVQSWPKPLSVKSGGPAWRAVTSGTGLQDPGGTVTTIAASSISAHARRSADVVAMFFLESGVGLDFHEIGRAEAVVRLMSQTMDAERYGDALFRLAQLSSAAPAYAIARKDPTPMAQEIDRVVAMPDRGYAAVERHDLVGPLKAVSIGEEAVVLNSNNGRLVSLESCGDDLLRQASTATPAPPAKRLVDELQTVLGVGDLG